MGEYLCLVVAVLHFLREFRLRERGNRREGLFPLLRLSLLTAWDSQKHNCRSECGE